jgi:hypothetical protein
MELLDRLKKEMSEGVVKALLEDAQKPQQQSCFDTLSLQQKESRQP